MHKPALTIAIPSITERHENFNRLISFLTRQMTCENLCRYVELIYDIDDKEVSIGAKRQSLLLRAKGKYIVMIDDDDWVSPEYVIKILDAISKSHPDHVGFLEDCTIDGVKSKSIFSIQHKKWDENKFGYDHIRCANPKSVILREKALEVGYNDMRYAEDKAFSESVTKLLKTEEFINEVLYYYRYKKTEHNQRYGIK